MERRRWKEEDVQFRDVVLLDNSDAYCKALDEVFTFTENLFDDYPDMKLYEPDNSKKFTTRWGQTFDAEQLLSHAIVHILKHTRQIEKFKIKLKEMSI